MITTLLLITSVLSQAPEKISYQAMIRNADNQLVTSQSIGMRISILQGSESENTVYEEIYNPNPSTNANGLVSVEIGSGIAVSGNFTEIDWADGPYFIMTETDPTGGTNYTITGTSQILSVPYALHANTSDSLTGTLNEKDPTWVGSTTSEGAIAREGSVRIGSHFINSAFLGVRGIGTGEGGVVFCGEAKSTNAGNPPVSGMGTRMMWYPDKAAFRAGYAASDKWDKDNTGLYSVAFGQSTMASGDKSFAVGRATLASGLYSVAMGSETTASATSTVALGQTCIASEEGAISIGRFSEATGFYSIAIGSHNLAEGTSSTALGKQCDATGNSSTAIGALNTASGSNSTAMGVHAQASGLFSFAINLSNTDGPVVGNNTFRISGAAEIGGNLPWTNHSDRRLKKNIEPLVSENSLQQIMQLNGVRFEWMEYNNSINLGFIAQDVLDIVPEAVRYDETNDIYSMEYSALIPILVEGMKEQQAEIERLRSMVEKLQAERNYPTSSGLNK